MSHWIKKEVVRYCCFSASYCFIWQKEKSFFMFPLTPAVVLNAVSSLFDGIFALSFSCDIYFNRALFLVLLCGK